MIRGYAWIIWFYFVTYGITTTYSCTRCSDFNREVNPSIKCPASPNQCGDCKVGFRSTTIPDDGSCEKIRPPELRYQPPSSVYSSLGEEINLPCIFRPKDRVDCVWLRRGFHVEINNRYKYKDSVVKGLNTSDCSLTISDFKSTDIGEWQCGSLADSNSEGVMSDGTIIGQKETFTEMPKDSIADLGDNVTLKCTFDKEVDCVWLRNTFHLEISNRYSFINNGTGKSVKDCSMRITNVSWGDLGKWQCGSMADSQKEGILSTIAILKSKTNQTNQNPTTRGPQDTVQESQETTKDIGPHPTTNQNQQQTTEIKTNQTNISATEITNVEAIDLVFLGFIVVLIVLGFVVIIGIVMLVYYKRNPKIPNRTPQQPEAEQPILGQLNSV